MSAFFYFFPGRQKSALLDGHERLRRDVLAEHKLDRVLADVTLAPAHAVLAEVGQDGPGGSPGVILYAKPGGQRQAKDLPRVGYYAKQQRWFESPQGHWLGVETKQPPGPEDLSREKIYYGYGVPDEQGNVWSIPIAYSPRGEATLPCDYRFTNGHVESRLKPSFKQYWELACAVYDYFCADASGGGTAAGQEATPGGPAWLAQQALAALSINYRLGPDEANVLLELGRPLISSETATQICYALIDQPTIEEFKEHQSKNRAAGPSGAAGSDSTPGGPADNSPSAPASVS